MFCTVYTFCNRLSKTCLQFVIVVFPDHTHLLFFTMWMACIFNMVIKISVKFVRLFHCTKVLIEPSLNG